MQDGNGNDPFASLEQMMTGVPGGEYFLMMMKNNPDAREALSSIDPNDPDSLFAAMRRIFGAFGIGGPQADMLIDQARRMMDDPAQVQAMMQQHGVAGAPGAAGLATGAAPSAPRPQAPADPRPWESAAERAENLIEEGRERAAFDLLTGALDHGDVASWDPRDASMEGVADVLEVLALESRSAGRLVPIRFAPLYARWAMAHDIIIPAPGVNPEFSEWTHQIANAIADLHDDASDGDSADDDGEGA